MPELLPCTAVFYVLSDTFNSETSLREFKVMHLPIYLRPSLFWLGFLHSSFATFPKSGCFPLLIWKKLSKIVTMYWKVHFKVAVIILLQSTSQKKKVSLFSLPTVPFLLPSDSSRLYCWWCCPAESNCLLQDKAEWWCTLQAIEAESLPPASKFLVTVYGKWRLDMPPLKQVLSFP